jgi:GT2 family glycosyltransferase
MNIFRRAYLTLKHLGLREFLYRVVTFPLRFTRYAERIGGGVRFGANPGMLRRWCKHHGRPVTVVIPTYGDPTVTLKTVKAVRKTTSRKRVRVVVADDGSPPEDRAKLRLPRGVELVEGENAGFAANANRGLRRATEGDVVLLNSDVIPDRYWLDVLQYSVLRSKTVGIAGPMLRYPDGRIQSAGSYRNLAAPEWFDHRFRFRSPDDDAANVPTPVLATTGACMYVRREVLDEVGLLDERYAMAYEDVDWCLRAWEAGYEVAYVPNSRGTHLESVTRGKEVGERELQSQARFWEKWGDWFDARDVRTPDGRLRVIYVTEDTGVGGGHRDVFEHLNRLAERGHEAELYSLGEHPEWFDLNVPTRTFEDYDALVAALSEVDAIKVATWWNTALPVWKASLRRGRPVYFVQDIETSYYPNDAWVRANVLASYREEFTYLTISEWNRSRLRELGRDAQLMPPGIDLDNFRPRDVKREENVVLALGRTNPLKNLPLTIDAWKALGENGPELWMFGIEPELGPKYGARYIERPTDEGVAELLNQATVFVQTSTHEGFCLPPLEAMACDCPVVCTDAHGNRDFCVDGENCLIPEPTVESVSGALRRVLQDRELRERLVKAGRATAAEYAWERRIDALEKTFETLADHRPQPSGARPEVASS